METQKKEKMMIQFILILIERQTKNNQRKNIREKKAKKYHLESDKSETDEIYQRENKELFKRMVTPKKGDDDYLVDTDTGRDTNNEESEEIYRTEEIKKIFRIR